MKLKINKNTGFTLIELLIVIAIIGLLASIVLVALGSARIKSREALRRADLKQVRTALELYYNDNNSYPSTSTAWHGEASLYGSYGYSGATGYIPNLAPTYLAQLPSDPNVNKVSSYTNCLAGQSGFLYISDGIDYKFLNHCSIEAQPLATDPFYDPIRPTWAIQVSSPGAGPKGW